MLRGLERPRRSDSPAARDAEVVEKAVQIAAIAAAAGAPEPPAPPVRKGMGWFPRESLGLQLWKLEVQQKPWSVGPHRAGPGTNDAVRDGDGRWRQAREVVWRASCEPSRAGHIAGAQRHLESDGLRRMTGQRRPSKAWVSISFFLFTTCSQISPPLFPG